MVGASVFNVLGAMGAGSCADQNIIHWELVHCIGSKI